MCAGRHLAYDSVWLAMSRILATFTISEERDEDGGIVQPDITFATGFTRHPEPFLCEIHPRDDKARDLIQSIVD
ncbi:hypothetical protein BDY19DRAFT_1053531 [Irpex rosettiformis]|uniref:Uncharacterized protein n=1 Tax=Irpex rosettiformis TaxID=378272 RepID=A0ACB8UEZ8_9APHY|nr:hypothetical protein BDY19DRAFT_1053531 [Irpex rosettiformis]